MFGRQRNRIAIQFRKVCDLAAESCYLRAMGDTIKDVMRIECPATTAFDLMADVRNELDWNSGVSEVELLTAEPIGKGSRFRIVDQRGQQEVKITTYKRPDTLSLFLSGKSMDVDIDFTLVEQGNITVMTGRFNAKVRGLMRFFFPLLVPLIRRDIAKEHKTFIALCEAKASAQSPDK